MPHLTVYAVESQLAGVEPALTTGLTEAVTTVYGEWVRSTVVVRLIGVPDVRWTVGGEIDASRSAPEVRMGIRAIAFARDDWPTVAQRLVGAITDAVAAAVGEGLRESILVELLPERDDRIALGGALIGDPPQPMT
ncbi:MAG TPA: hypothetical protein PLY19_00205 [Rhodoglobus sp.]|nr:hypothetical protein [Rhodoglobus sp.]